MRVYVKSEDHGLLNLSAAVIARYTLWSALITCSHLILLGRNLTHFHPPPTHTHMHTVWLLTTSWKCLKSDIGPPVVILLQRHTCCILCANRTCPQQTCTRPVDFSQKRNISNISMSAVIVSTAARFIYSSSSNRRALTVATRQQKLIFFHLKWVWRCHVSLVW